MNTFVARTGAVMLMVLIAAGNAHAQSEKTREQVKAETREAMRLGLFPLDDVGRAPRDIYIGYYPPLPSPSQTMATPSETKASGPAIPVGAGKG